MYNDTSPRAPIAPRRARPWPRTTSIRRYGEGDAAVDAVRGVSLDVPRGQFTAIMGPSRLRQVHAHAPARRPRPPDRRHASRSPARTSRRWATSSSRCCAATHVGFVFQAFNLLPTLTAEENILLPLSLAGRKLDRGLVDVGHRARRPRRPPHAPPVGAVRRPAAARRRRPGARRRADRAVRRRADRQPRLARRATRCSTSCARPPTSTARRP